MKRIIMHWTAGGYTPSKLDLSHYHFVVNGDGVVLHGALPVEANKAPLGKAYAAHTRNCNTDSIGVAIAAMAGAKDRPFSAGKAPMTQSQVNAAAALVARLCKQYNISVTRETVLTHAEVQPTLNIPQRGKWDIVWWPHLAAPIDPVAAGDIFRGKVKDSMMLKARPAPMPQPPRKLPHNPRPVQTPAQPVSDSYKLPFGGFFDILRKIIGVIK